MGSGWLARIYQIVYEATLGMSLTDWLRRDFEREPLPYLLAVIIIGLWLEPPKSWKWSATGLVVVVFLVSHVLS